MVGYIKILSYVVCCRINVVRLAAQTAREAKVDREIKSLDSGEVALARTELTSLLIKKHPSHVRSKL